MSHQQICISYEVLTVEELSPSDRKLVEKARRATETSYSPYSHFHVGAAVEMEDGTIFCGSNQENAAFSVTTCAERTALSYAHAEKPETAVAAIAIAARNTDGAFTQSPISPCGVCRQALMEAQTRAKKPVRVLLCGRDEIIICRSVNDLLPFAFEDFS